MILNVYVDELTYRRLLQASAEDGRRPEELAEAAVADAAIRAVPDPRPPHLRDRPLREGAHWRGDR